MWLSIGTQTRKLIATVVCPEERANPVPRLFALVQERTWERGWQGLNLILLFAFQEFFRWRPKVFRNHFILIIATITCGYVFSRRSRTIILKRIRFGRRLKKISLKKMKYLKLCLKHLPPEQQKRKIKTKAETLLLRVARRKPGHWKFSIRKVHKIYVSYEAELFLNYINVSVMICAVTWIECILFSAIFLGSQKTSFENFKKMILNCDENLKESAIESLLRYLPSGAEVCLSLIFSMCPAGCAQFVLHSHMQPLSIPCVHWTPLYCAVIYSTVFYSRPSLACPSLLYHTYPTLPYPTLLCSALTYPTLPYTTQSYSTLLFATLPY